MVAGETVRVLSLAVVGPSSGLPRGRGRAGANAAWTDDSRRLSAGFPRGLMAHRRLSPSLLLDPVGASRRNRNTAPSRSFASSWALQLLSPRLRGGNDWVAEVARFAVGSRSPLLSLPGRLPGSFCEAARPLAAEGASGIPRRGGPRAPDRRTDRRRSQRDEASRSARYRSSSVSEAPVRSRVRPTEGGSHDRGRQHDPGRRATEPGVSSVCLSAAYSSATPLVSTAGEAIGQAAYGRADGGGDEADERVPARWATAAF